MNSLGVWTLVIILYQTVACVVMSWLTLGCRLAPAPGELHELTLLKLLYLYEPAACGTTHFYNYTVRTTSGIYISTIAWPINNSVAAAFRSKMKLWLCLHVLWLALAVLHLTQSHRPCGLYAALLPLCCAGAALLLVDLVHAALFLRDIEHTRTEQDIFEYIQSGEGSLRWISKVFNWRVLPLLDEQEFADTSWAAALLAYASCRGLVQWLVNFWIVKDNYFEGLAAYPCATMSEDVAISRCALSNATSTRPTFHSTPFMSNRQL